MSFIHTDYTEKPKHQDYPPRSFREVSTLRNIFLIVLNIAKPKKKAKGLNDFFYNFLR